MQTIEINKNYTLMKNIIEGKYNDVELSSILTELNQNPIDVNTLIAFRNAIKEKANPIHFNKKVIS